MKITFLQAGNGDCIHIEDGCHHVIIDSGEKCPELISLVDAIGKANQVIDLLIITHYDSDHIKGIISILEAIEVDARKHLLRKVWFNATKLGYRGNEKLLSAQDANRLAELLLDADVDWVSELTTGKVEIICEALSIEVIDGGEIYAINGEGEMMGNEKVDWDSSLCELERYLDDDVTDSSKTNSQSIILVLHYKDSSILLPGDAIPEKLLNALDEYRKEEIARFVLVKLPHHGSYKNITKEILDKIECSDYVVSTNGERYFHPNKKMMIKIFKWGKFIEGKKLTFHLNYYDDLYKKMNITEAEKRHYNFECDGQRIFEF